MRNIRSVEDQLHSLEQIYGHFVFICPVDDMGHLEFSSSLGYLRTQKSREYVVAW